MRVNILEAKTEFSEGCRKAGYIPPGLADKRVTAVRTLSGPAESRARDDLFDRLLLSQAKTENPFFLTHDERIPEYEGKCVVPV